MLILFYSSSEVNSRLAPLYTNGLSGVLNDYLADIEEQAQNMMWTLTKQISKAESVTEELKRRDQMAWVGAMNNIRARVCEIINNELIYS